MTTHAAATTWPTNASAYRKILTGSPALAGALGVLLTNVTPEALLAGGIALAGNLGVLFTARPWLKAGFSWVATLLASLALVLGSYEGEQGVTWSGIAQWDLTDIATVGLLVVSSLLHTLVPNAAGTVTVPDSTATGDAVLLDDEAADVPAPPTAAGTGGDVGYADVPTSALRVLTPEQVAADAAAKEVQA